MPFSPKREKNGYVFLVSVCILGNTLPNPKNDDVTVNHLFGYLWQPRRERPGNKTLPAPLYFVHIGTQLLHAFFAHFLRRYR
jgi:hypothetical protein